MTSWLAFPPAGEVRGRIAVPPSKSATNRALVLAAISDAPVEVVRPLESEDTRAISACLAAMGARFEPTSDGVRVSGPLGAPADRVSVLDVRDSGTAARFLAAVASGVPGDFRLTGSPRLRERPMGPLVDALRAAGADIDEEGDPGRLPLRIRGRRLAGGRITVDASQSSQFLSALLLLASAGAPLEIAAAGAIASAPYVDMTIEALIAFGKTIRGGGAGAGGWSVVSAGPPPARYETPGDYSSAVPLLAAAGVCGGEISLSGLAWPTADADARAIPALEAMGVEISASAMEIVARAERGRLRPARVVATDFPDSVPALAALAAFAPGESLFSGVGHLRIKESDRLAALSRVLRDAGRDARDGESELVVKGLAAGEGPANGAALPTFGDHRIAMAAALLALGTKGIRIENPDCVGKSYPDFFRDLDAVCVRPARDI